MKKYFNIFNVFNISKMLDKKLEKLNNELKEEKEKNKILKEELNKIRNSNINKEHVNEGDNNKHILKAFYANMDEIGFLDAFLKHFIKEDKKLIEILTNSIVYIFKFMECNKPYTNKNEIKYNLLERTKNFLFKDVETKDLEFIIIEFYKKHEYGEGILICTKSNDLIEIFNLYIVLINLLILEELKDRNELNSKISLMIDDMLQFYHYFLYDRNEIKTIRLVDMIFNLFNYNLNKDNNFYIKINNLNRNNKKIVNITYDVISYNLN